MQQLTGSQAGRAIVAWALLAVAVPLFGILLIPFVALFAAGQGLARVAGVLGARARPVLGRLPGATAAGVYGWQR